mmetsp:Transcript_71087/g.224785  ORF Transcript_71087/g.224785 Transcript_71087/m.224785 type:complete len:379 (+) Transcript_71087:403-1539(+)
MKLLKKEFEKNGGGSIRITPENTEDMWQIYNLVARGDHVTANSFRKVQRETGAGGMDSERVKVKLTLMAEAVEYDAEVAQIRVRGQNAVENEHVKLGAYHTLELEPNRAVTLHKELWDELDVQRIKESCDPAANADLAVCLVQEGLAHLVLVGGSCTVMRAKVETNMPRKRGAAIAGYDKAVNKFFENTLQAILRHVDFSIVRCLVIAGPGFTKDELETYIWAEAQRRDMKSLFENRSKVITAHASSGYKHALKEVLSSPTIMHQIKDTQALAEVKALEAFYEMMGNDSARAFYGPGHVLAALELGAVQTLLLSDSLFRNQEPAERTKWVRAVEGVKEAGGVVHVFSAMHVSGEQLGQLTGVAAILRFPLPDLEDEEL